MPGRKKEEIINNIISVYGGIRSREDTLSKEEAELRKSGSESSLEVQTRLLKNLLQHNNARVAERVLGELEDRVFRGNDRLKGYLFKIRYPNEENMSGKRYDGFSAYSFFKSAKDEKKRQFFEMCSEEELAQIEQVVMEAKARGDSEGIETYRAINKEVNANLGRLEKSLEGDPQKDEILKDLRAKLSQTVETVRGSNESYANQLETFGKEDRKRISEERYRKDEDYRRKLDDIGCPPDGDSVKIFDRSNLKKTGKTNEEMLETTFGLMTESLEECMMRRNHPQQEGLIQLCEYIHDNLLPKGDVKVAGEQGFKVYGLDSFLRTCGELQSELEKKDFDLEKINRLRGAYDTELEKYMKAMRMATPICGSTTNVLGNIGNAREPYTPDVILKMPRENELVNGVFLLSAMAKQMNVKPRELFSDPKKLWKYTYENLAKMDYELNGSEFRVDGEKEVPPVISEETISPYRAYFNIFQSRLGNPESMGFCISSARSFDSLVYLLSDNNNLLNRTSARIISEANTTVYSPALAMDGMTDRLMFAAPGDKMGRLGTRTWDFDKGGWISMDDFNVQEKAKNSQLIYDGTEDGDERAFQESENRLADVFLAVTEPIRPNDVVEGYEQYAKDRSLLAEKMLSRASSNLEKICKMPEVDRYAALAGAAMIAADKIVERKLLYTTKEREDGKLVDKAIRFTNRAKVAQLIDVWNAARNSELSKDPETLSHVYRKLRDDISSKRMSFFHFLNSEYWDQKELIDKMDKEYSEMQKALKDAKELEAAGQRDHLRELEDLQKHIAKDGGDFSAAKKIRSIAGAVPKDKEAVVKYVTDVARVFVQAQTNFYSSSDIKAKHEALSGIRALAGGILTNEANSELFGNKVGKEALEQLRGWNNCMDVIAQGIERRGTLVKPDLHLSEKHDCVSDILLGEMVKGLMDYRVKKEDNLPEFEPGSMPRSFAQKDEMKSFLRAQIEDSAEFKNLMNLPDNELIKQLNTDRVHEHAGRIIGQCAQKITEKVEQLNGSPKQAAKKAAKVEKKSVVRV